VKKKIELSSLDCYAQVFEGSGKPMVLKKIILPPSIGDEEVLVELEIATICGSDLHTIQGKRKAATPLVLGSVCVFLCVPERRVRVSLTYEIT